MTNNPVVAVIGMGFSGIVSAYNLVLEATRPFTILLFDDSQNSVRGVAYSTNCPFHLLNVPADNMGALSSDPKHFYSWLQASPQEWRKKNPSFQDIQFDSKSFVPRMIYGCYLEHIADQLKKIAAAKDIEIQKISEKVTDIQQKPEGSFLLFTQRGQYPIQAAILATGIPWAYKFNEALQIKEQDTFLPNLWPKLTNMTHSAELLKKYDSKSTVGIIGSGLTMLDALATLHSHQYPGIIVVFAGRGLLPQIHQVPPEANYPSYTLKEFPNTALGLLKKTRQLVRKAQDSGGHWQTVFQSIRPITVPLWQRLPVLEKKKLMRHLFGFWNSHRHRAAPEVLALVDYFFMQNKLKIINARAVSLNKNPNGKLTINFVDPETKQNSNVNVDLVVNCAGPELSIKKHPSELIQNLVKGGLAEPDSLGLGLAVDSDGSVFGKAYKSLFAVGTILFGTNFETVAVPELRQQCYSAARGVLCSIGCK